MCIKYKVLSTSDFAESWKIWLWNSLNKTPPSHRASEDLFTSIVNVNYSLVLFVLINFKNLMIVLFIFFLLILSLDFIILHPTLRAPRLDATICSHSKYILTNKSLLKKKLDYRERESNKSKILWCAAISTLYIKKIYECHLISSTVYQINLLHSW